MFIDKLINESCYFNNVYGYGETYSTTYSAITGEDIYDNFCDAGRKLKSSFKIKSNLGSIARENGFETIYYRNLVLKVRLIAILINLESINSNFKYKHIRKRKIKDNLDKFINKNNLKKRLNSDKKFLILLHDYSLHDSQEAYDGLTKKILKSANNSSNKVKENLSSLSYNKNKDILIFFLIMV